MQPTSANDLGSITYYSIFLLLTTSAFARLSIFTHSVCHVVYYLTLLPFFFAMFVKNVCTTMLSFHFELYKTAIWMENNA